MPGDGLTVAGDNLLVERYLEVDDFANAVDAAAETLAADLLATGAAQDVLQTWAELLNEQASDLAKESTVVSEAASIAAYFATEG